MKNWRTFFLSLLVCANTAFAAPQEMDKVAAIVNNGVVLESDVNNLLQSVKLTAQQEGQQLPDEATLRSQIIERLIMDQILLQMGQSMGINITNDNLDRAIAGIAQQNRMTVDQLRRRLSQEGINYNTYRNQIRKEMITTEVRNNEVRRRISILPQEVEALSQQISTQNSGNTEVNLSHILLPLPENPSQKQVDQTEAQANHIIEELKKGANFSRMAMSYSADSQALQGGQMGWGKIGELPTLFAERLQYSDKGDIVGPIRSNVGFHILKVNDVRGGQQNVSVTEVHARHILLRSSVVMTDDQAKASLINMRNQIVSGQRSFEELAKENSQDPGTAIKGGDLGWAVPSIYDPAFNDALSRLNKGEISQPVHSSFGWHLIQLLDSRQVDRTDDAQKDRAYRMLFNRKFAEEAQTWMQEQRASAYVKIMGANAQ